MSRDQQTIPESDSQWLARLGEERFYVCRRHGTEPPFSGALLGEKRPGRFHCAGCDAILFSSDGKYDSGSGWPSFFDAIEGAEIDEIRDTSHGMVRIELRCGQCGSHLGHLFPDGPPPTGLRYCVNSLSLVFHPENNAPSKQL
ncbi:MULTISPECIES: peptide-methionine (R)-S-oxide reductase MsrB [unclassified Iodidimonas]|jgi:peptide-methionine (R)-S-oxide reductase|uniref:peptide-methionine (R)-S-oxide reductase MsrB n=1 Tax=unclassified Iodidimonas TaxID=2626145 RepID=UPI0024827373|nr:MULTISPECIES: peptide-methionine (R)-S-oxide reductase MsrB [unclassified Iodidimonas]